MLLRLQDHAEKVSPPMQAPVSAREIAPQRSMLLHLQDYEIERLIEEDVPYGDLTTHLLGISQQQGVISFTCREDTVLCATEEAGLLLEKCGCRIIGMQPSGTFVSAGTTFLVSEGNAQALHTAWKAAMNLLEYASGIATRTHRIVSAVKSVNPRAEVVSTRKSFPGTKKLVIKAITAGGALPHRLGLSESVLVFRQHLNFVGGLGPFLKMLDDLRRRAVENKVIVEAESREEALLIAQVGVDVIQLDKLPALVLKRLIPEIRAIDPRVVISIAGGVNENNAAEYADTGVDLIVLSSVYFGKPADIRVDMEPL